ncbi:hypothetical protein ACFWIJ_34605 [Streptomyces sp. NPDC127079]|uniref:hypothetical protein n=1 Tax=Streptomyces sp. NPDC127079 TaxID=3347132 RepID=UPI00365424FC
MHIRTDPRLLRSREAMVAAAAELFTLAGSGRLDLAPSLTDHIPLAEAPEAIHRLERKTGNPIRLVLVP